MEIEMRSANVGRSRYCFIDPSTDEKWRKSHPDQNKYIK